MSEFNLIDEPWISVVTDYKGTTKLVGLREFFQNAQTYIDFAGDMPTQGFAVMRFLLAILHTVFSRYDANGKPYEMVNLNEKMQQVENVDEEYEEEYEDALMETWESLWKAGKFPEIVTNYLECWHDRFYLFDDEYPFYQVTKEEIFGAKISKEKPSETLGKNINRLISESGNKIALFSPKYSFDDNKEILDCDEVARWLISFHSYASLSDKVRFSSKDYKVSKGWLFDLGGVFLSSDNLCKTLILNLVLVNTSNTDYNANIQKPVWEYKPSDVIGKYLRENKIDNIAELYTSYSRAIYISDFDPKKPFKMGIVKLPEVLHENNFLEPMTVWRYNNSGPNKGKFTPRKHQLNKSLWRSFGLITETEDANEGNENTAKRKPGIIDWLNYVDDYIGDGFVKINAISMEDDGNAMSWVPTNEIVDSLYIQANLVNDLDDDGWIFRINKVVDKTKYIVDKIFRSFVNDTKKIRNIESNEYSSKYIESLYYELDKPFRDWLASIDYEDSMDEKTDAWYKELKKITISQAEKIVAASGPRDFTGIIEGDSVRNIATAFNFFMARINKEL
ncbi:type I-E CRISPR-associated protein Cse1/CasA [Anaerococcus degeneri]|uniref:Type I-E CRISPR-associated protein Cse1/CasA n=1 Tax=Anaerococcus degeneri TaxID=361500 RepID=A0ABS7YY34_9FIRM|nr:type I-E CRISPR-associated protein Cse1/CasA [Anaerococcus degeneri]MBP2016155.1 CRISPR system Cascade subunit CasA [Anaerococcus degeneri]MCA2096640.1 type I-E CRISPR-associated protein Cse1/CasA [Anaerococcus degeneri]